MNLNSISVNQPTYGRNTQVPINTELLCRHIPTIVSQSVKNQILAVGVALLIGYLISYLFIFFIDSFGAISYGKSDNGRRMRDFVTRHLHIFGIACMLSVSKIPGLYGTFHAIFAWITVLIIISMYIIHLIPPTQNSSIVRTIPLVIYYICVFAWYVGIVVYFFKSTQRMC